MQQKAVIPLQLDERNSEKYVFIITVLSPPLRLYSCDFSADPLTKNHLLFKGAFPGKWHVFVLAFIFF